MATNKEKLKRIYNAIADDDEKKDLNNELKDKHLNTRFSILDDKLDNLIGDLSGVKAKKFPVYDDSEVKSKLVTIEKSLKENDVVKSLKSKNEGVMVNELSTIAQILIELRSIIQSRDDSLLQAKLLEINKSLQGLGNLLLMLIGKTGQQSDRALTRYKISDIDSVGVYYGYLADDGSWYIMSGANGIYRYIQGNSGYIAAWSGRAGLSYDYFNIAFKA